ncbi:endonuclease/exonuclease/phosphatase family protein [Pontibacter sp. CAU 1760]
MKIVTWNCNGALRKKLEALVGLEADIYIIQECENPAESKDPAYAAWAANHLWTGDTRHKGLGIFASNEVDLRLLPWSNTYQDHTVKHFLPCAVNGDFDLLAVWTHQNNSPNFGYIGQLWKYLQVNKDKLGRTIIAGDLNSNTRWDEWDRWWNHSDVVAELREAGMESLYHRHTSELQGRESQPTFYFRRNPERPYHIDYIFSCQALSNHLINLEIGPMSDWLKLSDHLPLSCAFEYNL